MKKNGQGWRLRGGFLALKRARDTVFAAIAAGDALRRSIQHHQPDDVRKEGACLSEDDAEAKRKDTPKELG